MPTGYKTTITTFAIQLQEVHGDKIKLRADAIYTRTSEPIKVVCSVCENRWEPRPNDLLKGRGCPKCSAQKSKDSFGIKRCRRVPEATKQKARDLKAKGWTEKAIAQEIGHDPGTVNRWVNPEAAERKRIRDRARVAANREKHRANSRRYNQQTPHGKAGHNNRNLLRQRNNEAEWKILSQSEREEVLALGIERDRLNAEAGYVKYHVDHIYPDSLGGATAPYNLRIMLAKDNMSKGARISEADWSLYQTRVAALFN